MNNINTDCHTGYSHNFYHPFCERFSPTQQLKNLAFSAIGGVATLGIPHLIHYFGEFYSSYTYVKPNLLETIDKKVNECKTELENQRNKQINFSDIPTEQEIKDLWGEFENELESLNQKLIAFGKKNNPWISPEIRTQCDTCLKLAFLISVLILKNLDTYVAEENKNGGQVMTKERALIKQEGSLLRYRAFLEFADLYRFARIPLTYFMRGETLCTKYLDFPSNASLFFQQDTAQSNWRELNNLLYQYTFSIVDKVALENEDDRFTKMIVEDLKPCFKLYSGTRPS